MRVELVGHGAPAPWDEWLERIAAQGFRNALDPCFGAVYHRAHAAHLGAEACCLRVSEGHDALVLPHLRVPIDGELRDVQSAHGYGGPLATTTDDDFLRRAWTAAKGALTEEGVVACFLRLHPLAENARFLDGTATLRDDRPTVSIEVSRGNEGAALGNHRNMLARATRLGLSHEVLRPTPDDLDAFAALYDRTMDRLAAGEAYRFPRAYLATLATGLGDALSLARVCAPGGRVLAAALALWGPTSGDYHLAARDDEGDNCAGNLLLDALTREARRRGLSALHLGGGRTARPDDALWRFKSRVGTGRHVFRTAGLVLDRSRYDELITDWTLGPGRGSRPHWFLGWRQPPN